VNLLLARTIGSLQEQLRCTRQDNHRGNTRCVPIPCYARTETV
jgi:hypothetical protein